MSEGKFGEPWRFAAWDESHRHIFTRDDTAVYMNGSASQRRKERIIACVNVFANIDDPAAAIERWQGIKEAAKKFNEEAPEIEDGGDLDYFYEVAVEFLAAVRAALGKGEG